MTDLIVPPPEESYEDAEIHFSVHASPRLLNENVIHRSVRRGNDTTSSSSLYTTALKQDGMFAPIMFVVCGDMKSSRSDLPDKKLDDIVCLAEDVNTATDQYRFMVVVGPAGRIFGPNPTGPFDHHPSRLVQRPYADYELVVISSYFNMPALPHTIDLVFGTTAETGPQRGLHWKEVYNLYTDCNMMYADGYFEQIHGQAGK